MHRDLVVQATNGDQRALESLLVMSHPRLYRVAYGILRDRHLAEDATRRAILDIWRAIRRLRDPSKFDGWSSRLLMRICYDEARRQRAWVPDVASQAFASLSAPDQYGSVLDRDQLDAPSVTYRSSIERSSCCAATWSTAAHADALWVPRVSAGLNTAAGSGFSRAARPVRR